MEKRIDPITRNLRRLFEVSVAHWKLIVKGLVAVVILIGLFVAFNLYWEQQQEKGAELLSQAHREEGENRKKLLGELIDDYGRTPSGRIARFELALMLRETSPEEAKHHLMALVEKRSVTSALRIAALHTLAKIAVSTGELEDALIQYRIAAADPSNLLQLQSYFQEGLVLEAMGKKKEATERYQSILDQAGEADGEIRAQTEERLLWLIATKTLVE